MCIFKNFFQTARAECDFLPVYKTRKPIRLVDISYSAALRLSHLDFSLKAVVFLKICYIDIENVLKINVFVNTVLLKQYQIDGPNINVGRCYLSSKNARRIQKKMI